MTSTVLSLGGLRFELSCDEPGPLTALLAGVLGPAPLAADQAVPSGGSPALRLTLRFDERAGRPGLRPTLVAAGSPRRWLAERYDLRAHWDEASAAGEATLQPTPLAVRALLQLALSVLLPARGGLVLHAACAVHRDAAYLFPARSGVGKSTLLRHSGGSPPLADELSLVSPDPAGRWHAWASPFWSADRVPPPAGDPAPDWSRPWPLARLCFLAQAPRFVRTPLSEGQAVDRLLRHSLNHGEHPLLATRLLSAAAGLAASVPAETVGVPEGLPVWPFLVPAGEAAPPRSGEGGARRPACR